MFRNYLDIVYYGTHVTTYYLDVRVCLAGHLQGARTNTERVVIMVFRRYHLLEESVVLLNSPQIMLRVYFSAWHDIGM